MHAMVTSSVFIAKLWAFSINPVNRLSCRPLGKAIRYECGLV